MNVIIDYEAGNLRSIQNMLRKLGFETVISRNHEDIRNAKRLIFPGVGAFDNAMRNLDHFNLIKILNDQVLVKKTPILGICVGMQLMTNGSEEGELKGLGWIDAVVKRFPERDENGRKMIVPHMGWNLTNVVRPGGLFKNCDDENRFYFVHSYFVHCHEKSDIVSTTEYGTTFTSSFHKGNIWGVQFHPEKSHRFGMSFFQQFMEASAC